MASQSSSVPCSLTSIASEWCFDSRPTWHLRRWTNKLTGQALALPPGAEIGVELDAAQRRIWIEGWRSQTFAKKPRAGEGFARVGFDDAAWRNLASPNLTGWRTAPDTWFWMRTHVFVPLDLAGQPLTLLLGGWGVGDFRHMRVFLNGQLLGARQTADRWFAPGSFTLPASRLRFGQDNILAIELARQFWRPPKLERFDAHGAHSLPWLGACTPPYQQCVVAGTPSRHITFQTEQVQQRGADQLQVTLRGREAALGAELSYRLKDGGRTLTRAARLTNAGTETLRLLSVNLGQYDTGAAVSEGEMGFPVYANDECFFSVAHPAGWAKGERGVVSLVQYPGAALAAGQTFDCMTSALGVGESGAGRAAFRAHLQPRMRRVRRGHDRPYTLLETFGAWKLRPDDLDFLGLPGLMSMALREDFVLRLLRRVADFQRQTHVRFDAALLEFWCDSKGDMTWFQAQRFPHGFTRVRQALRKLGIAPGLWLDSSLGLWNIGDNPVVGLCRADNANYRSTLVDQGNTLCRATDPFATMFTEAFRHHLHQNGARVFKFDNLRSVCYNTAHTHWPGIYSTEAIYHGAVQTLRTLDRECPDVFLIGYWGYRSPWWLLDCDVIFECGLFMEASSPSPRPSLYARDGVTVGLDQGTYYAEDVPRLGKDSLGVWLSDWGWNSGIGKERWREGMIMDLCRGSMLLQPWSDERWLTVPERKQFADLVSLLRRWPDCFGAARPILGDPWREQMYGYSCANGQRAFLAINNCTWQDQRVDLQLNSAWGLAADKSYTVYRLHPRPARLPDNTHAAWLRPFEVALFEVVPCGKPPTLDRAWRPAQEGSFRENSSDVPLKVRRTTQRGKLQPVLVAERQQQKAPPWLVQRWIVRAAAPASAQGGCLVLSAELTHHGQAMTFGGIGKHFTACVRGGAAVKMQPVLSLHTFPAAWQAWRIDAPASARPLELEIEVGVCHPPAAQVTFAGHFVPNQ